MKKLTAWTLAIALLAACGPTQGEPANEKANDSDPVAKLHAAAKEGDVKAIGRLLSSGDKVDAKDQSGSTPLFVASLYGRADAAKLLIAKGADIKVAKGGDGSTALLVAAFFCHTDTVKLLLTSGSDINALNHKSETPLDVVSGPWSQELSDFYAGVTKALGLKLDLDSIKAARPKIAALLKSRGGKTGKTDEKNKPGKTVKNSKPTGSIKDVAALGIRCSYYCNGRIHVGVLGTPDGKPITEPPVKSWEDFKPSWSKTGDMLVFFRRLKNDPVTVNWKTAICIINVDGTGFHQLTDGTHTDFNQTWTRDGTNTPIWNRKNPATGGFYVMASKVGNRPGQEVALTDKGFHSWAYTCLKGGRILVQSAHPKQGHGYFLMTPNVGGEARFERIDCELAKKGLLDRVSVSPSEKRVCFEYQTGFAYKDTGRTLYIADFDAKKRSITNAKPFANEKADPNRWFAYPRWTKDETAIVYHASPSLYLYTLKDGSTVKVSTNDGADYRYPHCEATPK